MLGAHHPEVAGVERGHLVAKAPLGYFTRRCGLWPRAGRPTRPSRSGGSPTLAQDVQRKLSEGFIGDDSELRRPGGRGLSSCAAKEEVQPGRWPFFARGHAYSGDVSVSVSVELPEEIVARARRRADERGVSIDQVVTEALAAQLRDEGARDLPGDGGYDALEAFIGSGSSGRRERFDIHAARSELAKRKFAEGI